MNRLTETTTKKQSKKKTVLLNLKINPVGGHLHEVYLLPQFYVISGPQIFFTRGLI